MLFFRHPPAVLAVFWQVIGRCVIFDTVGVFSLWAGHCATSEADFRDCEGYEDCQDAGNHEPFNGGQLVGLFHRATVYAAVWSV